MSLFEDFARKYLREALKDLERALRAIREGDYPEAVFHAQQATEKAVKAMIEAKKEYVYNHGPRLAAMFIRVFENEWKPEYNEIINILGWFVEYYTRSRYPFLLRGRVIAPDEFIDSKTAKEALEKAKKVVEIAERYLREKGILQ